MGARSPYQSILALGFAVTTGCTGQIVGFGSSDGNTPGGPVPPSETPGGSQSALTCPDELKGTVAGTPLRRLTESQYDHTVMDLFGLDLKLAESFPPGDLAGPFPANGVSPVSDAHVRKFQSAAEEIATAVTTNPDLLRRLVPCEPNSGDRACAEEFIRTFGKRVYRRPLDEAQVTGLAALYDIGAPSGFVNGVRILLEAMLQSPYFLYHAEFRLPTNGEAMVMLDPYELASRLSYFLWDTMPDAELMRAAEAGELDSAAGLRAHAERMIADARFSIALQTFAINWLGIRGLRTISRDEAQFPIYTPELGAALERETVRFVDNIVRHGDGQYASLLTASYAFPDPSTFPIYGVASPANYDGSTPVEVPNRWGVITLPGVLAKHSGNDHSSPIKRGLFVLRNILCTDLPLPTNVDVPNLPEPVPGQTTRERFEIHTTNEGCASCHKAIDPIGFALERYDPMGAYREREDGVLIDQSGAIDLGLPDLDGPLDGAQELVPRIAGSKKAQECMSTQLLRFALRRLEATGDGCSLAALNHDFLETGNVRTALLSLVMQDSFRFRPAP